MQTERWQRARAVFERLLETVPQNLAAHLDEACGGDRELRRDVERLLAADEEAHGLEPPALAGGSPPDDVRIEPGDRVGEFVVRRRLESGGMGVVFEAEQREPKRLVALKVVLPAGPEVTLASRVRAEADILASLQHPGIAAVYTAGVHRDASGRMLPYFAMELVEDALDVVAWARTESCSLDQRLRLFLQVCDAVHAGHQKGVIHCDLKPQNLLVDRTGRVRVIDFGIAQVVGDPNAARSGHGTSRGLGTLAYLSPERLMATGEGLDVRADVYSLGVVAHELWCGVAPYDLAGKTVTEAAQLIAEGPRPAPRTLNPDLPRELEWILERALARDPAARYASAVELGADVRRFLEHEPVHAAPSGLGYPMRCFARRHRTGVVAGATVLLLLVVGLIATSLGWREAAIQERAALEQARRSGALRDVLRALLVEASPQRQGPRVKLLDGLDRIVDDVERAFAEQADLQAVTLSDLGHLQLDIGQWRRAHVMLERAVAIAEASMPDSRELAAALNLLGLAQRRLKRTAAAIESHRRALDILRDLGPSDDPQRAAIELNLASALGDGRELEQATAELERIHRDRIERLGFNDVGALRAGNNLAESYRKLGRLDQAIALSEQLLAGWRARHGARHRGTMTRLHNHAHLLKASGRYDDALAAEREVVEGWPESIGEDHPHIATALESAGLFALAADRYDEAEELFAAMLAHPSMADATPRQQAVRPLLRVCALVALGRTLEVGDPADLERDVREAAALEDEESSFVLLARVAAARAACASDPKDGRAQARLRAAVAGIRAVLGGEHWAAQLAAQWQAAPAGQSGHG